MGKTSIISTFIADHFPEHVDPVLCEVVIPAECSTNNCSLTIVDSSCMSSFQISYYLAVEEDHDITCDQIRLVSFYFILFI